MAEALTDARYPDVLIVTDPSFGRDEEHRDRLRAFIHEGITPLVTPGSHDYWIVHHVPDTSGGGELSRADVTMAPRPLRGIARMDIPRDASDASIVDYLRVLLEEVGHHWLVPADLAFRIAGRTVGMVSARDVVDRTNREAPWDAPALMGRSDQHWSSHFQGDMSPMDGVRWVDRGDQYGFTRWDQMNAPAQPVTAAWSGSVSRTVYLAPTYNDLDLVLMDSLVGTDAYPSTGNEARWMEPTLTAGLQTYHAGITVVLSQFDHICFGFYGDHRVLAVERVDTGTPTRVRLGDGRDFRQDAALRVVRRGSELLFQAAEASADLIDGQAVDSPPSTSPVVLEPSRFTTIARMSIPREPVAVGVLTRTWGPPGFRERGAFLTELDITAVEMRDGSGRRSFAVDRQPPPYTPGNPFESALSPAELRRFDVVAPSSSERAGEVRVRDGRLQIATRWGVLAADGSAIVGVASADLSAGTDRAPKALVRLGPGDFTFAARCRMRRAIFGPAIAGGAMGTSMWGTRRSVHVRDVIVPAAVSARWDGDSTLRLAYIITAPDRSSVQGAHLEAVDAVRRFGDSAIGMAARGRWRSTSTLGASVQGTRGLGVFYRGEGDWLRWRLFDGSRWHGEEVFDNRHPYPTRIASAPWATADWAGHRYAVFFRGESDRLHWKAHQAGRWHSHAMVDGGGPLTSDPAGARLRGGQLGLFYRGEGDWLVWRLHDGTAWHGEELFDDGHPYPTRMTSAPSAVSGWAGNRYAVFFRGDGDRLCWKAHRDGRWHGHAPVPGGGVMTSAPTAVRVGLGALAVFYRTEGDWLAWRLHDGTEWHGEQVFDDASGAPTRLPSGFLGPPTRPAAVAGWNGHRFGVFFRGEGDRLHWKAEAGARWHRHALIPDGSALASDPSLVST